MPEIFSGKNEPMGGMNFKKCWNENHMEKLSHDTDYDGICDICLHPQTDFNCNSCRYYRAVNTLSRLKIFFLFEKVKKFYFGSMFGCLVFLKLQI